MKKLVSLIVALMMFINPYAVVFADGESTGQDLTEPLNVTVTGDNQETVDVNSVSVTVENENAVVVFTGGENASADVSITESVNASGTGNVDGVFVDGSSSSVNIGQDVTVDIKSENTEGVYDGGVEAFSNYGTAEVNVGGNVAVSGESSNVGHSGVVGVNANSNGENGSTSVNIEGNVSVSGESNGGGSFAEGIGTSSNDENTSTEVHVGGDVSVSSNLTNSDEFTSASGVSSARSETSKNSSTKINVDGNVTVSGNSSGDVSVNGVSGSVKGEGSSVEHTIGGDVTVSAASSGDNFTYGASAYSYDNSSIEVTVGGNVTASAESSGNSWVSGVNVNSGDESNVEVSVEGNVNASSKADSIAIVNGVEIVSNRGSSSTVTVGGNVNVSVSNEAEKNFSDKYGVNASSSGEGTQVKIDIGGTIEVQTNKGAKGVSAEGKDGGAIDVAVGDGISVKHEYTGTGVDTTAKGENSQVTVNISGDVTVEGKGETVYTVIDDSKRTEPFYSQIGAAVKATVSDGGIINISITDGNSKSTASIDYTIKKDGETIDSGTEDSGFGVIVQDDKSSTEKSSGKSEVNTRVEDKDGKDEYTGESFENGNIIGGDTGLQVVLNENSDTSVNVVASGTISGGYTPVLVNKNVTEDNLELTVWQIVPTENEDGEEHVVLTKEVIDEENREIIVSNEQTQKIEKSIHYIIKVEPNENATLTTEGTTKHEGYDVANEGDRITLRVNASDGYYIEGAYNGLGERIPLQYADGVYYIDVPRGGGVYLSAKLGKREEASSGEGSSESQPTRLTSNVKEIKVETVLEEMESEGKAVIPAANRLLKGDERKMMSALSPIQQLMVVLTNAGFKEAVAASGFTLSEEAIKVLDNLKVDLRGAVQIVYRWENNVKVKWYYVDMNLPGNKIARFGFRQQDDGSWVCKML